MTIPADAPWTTLTSHALPLWVGLGHTLGLFKSKPSIDDLNQAARKLNLCNARGLPLHFKAQSSACGQRQYEAQIYEHGVIPTRADHWHDIFNACIWLTYPKTKAALNAIHANQPHDTSVRTRAGDTATLFDESGAILIGPDPRLARWLQDHEWQRAFVEYRHLWRNHRLLVVGHAVLEKLAAPYPGMIAKVIYQPWPDTDGTLDAPPAHLDQTMAARWLAQEFAQPAQLFPLPVLGIPGADPGNESPRFYDNTEVFRPLRPSSKKTTTNLTQETS